MAIRKFLLAAAAIGTAAFNAPTSAQERGGAVPATPSTTQSDAEINATLLIALVERRTVIANAPLHPSPGTSPEKAEESRRFAVAFIDRQIAKVKADLVRQGS